MKARKANQKKVQISSPKSLKSKFTAMPFQCTVCSRKFARNTHLTGHMRVHTGEKPYQCDLCEKRFRNASNMTEHRRIHTGERPYSCKWCGLTFSQSNHVTKHHKTCSSRGKKLSDSSKRDDQSTSGKSSLCAPAEIKQEKGVYFPCLFCSQNYRQHSAIEDHLISTHFKKILLRFQCDICGISYDKIGEYYDHKRSHNTDSKIVYACHVCGDPFYQFYELESHVKRHESETEFSCSVCSKCFASATDLNAHAKEHKESESSSPTADVEILEVKSKKVIVVDLEKVVPKGKNFECEYCGRGFSAERIWKKHVSVCLQVSEASTQEEDMDNSLVQPVVHLEEMPSGYSSTEVILGAASDDELTCKFCQRSFHRLYNYNNHMKTHLGYRPDFPCNLCEMKFEMESKLNEHRQEHLGELIKSSM